MIEVLHGDFLFTHWQIDNLYYLCPAHQKTNIQIFNIMTFLKRLLNLHQGEEKKEKVIENILSNISFRGANLWILACAILIASIGLNVNSTAVIIGAMLISPLMGPIVGAGFALATYDFDLLKKTGQSLLIATVVSLIVSFIYFYISPFKDVQSELLARTSPGW